MDRPIAPAPTSLSDHRKEKTEPHHDSQPPAGGERVGGKDCRSASALPVHRSGRKERLSVYADRSRARPARPSIVRIRRSFPSEREFMMRVPRRTRNGYWPSPHSKSRRNTDFMRTRKSQSMISKAEVIAAVCGGLRSLEEACSRYMLTVDEFLSWQSSIDQHGLAGL